jgi:hypothetical protein
VPKAFAVKSTGIILSRRSETLTMEGNANNNLKFSCYLKIKYILALLLQRSGVNDVRKVIGVYVWTPSKLREYMESLNITHDYFWSVNYVLPTVSLLVFFPAVRVLLFIVNLNVYYQQTTRSI